MRHWLIKILIFWVHFNNAHLSELYEWREMDPTELNAWYTSSDLCILKQELVSQVDIRKVAQEECQSNYNELIHPNGNITLGYAINEKQCKPPLKDRPYLTQVMKGYSNPYNTVLLDAIYEIIKTNSTLVFLGDSVVGQMYEAFFAEIIRLSPLRTKRIQKSEYRVHEKLYKNIILNGGDFDRLQINNNIVTIFWIRCVYVYGKGVHYSPTGHWSNATPILDNLIEEWNGIILLANIGLWYNDRRIYNHEIIHPLHWLQNKFTQSNNKLNSFGWQETTSQHFDLMTNGYFRTGPMYKNHRNCLANGLSKPNHRDTHDVKIDWRNEDIKRLLAQPNYSHIHLIHIAQATRPLHSLHVTRPKSQFTPWEGGEADCTHFCWTPTLWQPTWHGIARLVCNRFRYSNSNTDRNKDHLNILSSGSNSLHLPDCRFLGMGLLEDSNIP
eukprot:gene9711-20193_t